MRLLLDCPSGWYVEALRSGITQYRDPDERQVRILTTSLAPIPADFGGWQKGELQALVPDDQELVIVGEARTKTVLGWPMRVVEAECRRGTTLLERWLAAFYQSGERVGVALVRAPRGILSARRWRDLIALLSTARPAAAPKDKDEADVTDGLSGPLDRRPTSALRG